MPDFCEACGGPVSYGKCRECGAVSAHAAPSVQPDPIRTCPFDGTILHANGFCPSGSGFPITQRDCPDACPACRRPLRWDGDCPSCLPSGAKPGHLYTYDPFMPNQKTSGHWRLTVRGPQPLAGPTSDQRAALHTTLVTLAQRLAPQPSRSENHLTL